MNSDEKAVARLKSLTAREHGYFTGNATSAICVALRALGANGKVIVPVVTCANPAYAVIYAGYEPLFCDIDPQTYNLNPAHLRTLLGAHDDVRAVVMVHLYGRPCEIDEIQALTRARGVLLIEDAAQALGARYDAKPCGSFGDLSVFSFGPDKILGLQGGGALLFDDKGLDGAVARELRLLPIRPPDHSALVADYRKFYYAARNLELSGHVDEATSLFRSIPGKFRALYLFRPVGHEAPLVCEALTGLDDEIRQRTRNAEIYRRMLLHPDFEHPQSTSARGTRSAWWRYSFLYKGKDREGFLQKVRQAGIDASAWYPPIHSWFGMEGSFPHGVRHGRQIVNLWTAPAKSAEQVTRDCEAILALA